MPADQSSERTGPGLRVARVGGVPVHIGASWLVLAAVVTVLTASNLSSLGSAAYVVGLGYALTLLAAVLVHEGAHAAAARALGLEVHRVVADLWGGHTAYDGRTVTPGTAAVIAVCGPLSNLALAGLAFLAGFLVGDGGVPGLLLGGAVWVNTLLAVFNLLPGLPLDGGQLVDAAVWRLTGRRDRGLAAAGWSGRVLAAGVVAVVLLRPVTQGRAPDLFTVAWSVLIAGFLWSGATAAINNGRARRLLARARVRDVAGPVALLAPEAPIGAVRTAGGVAICLDERGRPTLVLLPLPDHRSLDDLDPGTPLNAVATRVPDDCVVEARPEDDLTDVVLAMQSTRWGVVVLTDGGRPWGVAGADAVNAALDA